MMRNLQVVHDEIKAIAFAANGICTAVGVESEDVRSAVMLHLICRAAGIDAGNVPFGIPDGDKAYAEAIANEVPL